MKKTRVCFLCVFAMLAFTFLGGFMIKSALCAQDKTVDVTIKEIMSDPPIEGHRPFKATFSPDGRYISYIWKNVDVDNKKRLWISRSDGKNNRGLVELTGDSYFWSGDSKYIYYAKEKNLYKINTESEDITQITDTESFPAYFVPSNQRNQIAYSSRDGISMYDLETGKVRTLFLKPGYMLEWSPNGNYLSFISQNRLYVYDTKNGWLVGAIDSHARDMSKAIYFFNGFRTVEWSPDSQHLAFIIDKPINEKRNIFVAHYLDKYVKYVPARNSFAGDPISVQKIGVLNMDTGTTTWIDHGENEDRQQGILNIKWSPNGNYLSFNKLSNIAGKRRIMIARPGEETVSILYQETENTWFDFFMQQFEWTLDSKAIIFMSQKDGFNHLYKLDVKKGKIKQLTTGNYEIHTYSLDGGDSDLDPKMFFIHPDGKSIIYPTHEVRPSELHLYKLDMSTGEKIKLGTEEGHNENAIISPDGTKILYQHSNLSRPYDYFILGTGPSDKPVQITDTISSKFKSIDWIQPEYITYENIEDGKTVYAHLFIPPNRDLNKRYPLLIFLHGGGYIQNVVRSWTYYHREYMFHHIMAHKGYVVLDIDFRGTSGYGREFSRDIHKKFGWGNDLVDVVSGIEYLKSLGCIDPERVGCYGGSGGGFLTLMGLCLKPGYFTCGAALRPATDFKNYNAYYIHQILGLPEKNPGVYEKSAPITYAEKLTRPLLLIHGLVDDTAFVQDTFQFAEKLIQAGIDFEFMIYPSESHSFIDPECWTDEYRRIERFMNKHLLSKKKLLGQK